MRTNLASLIRSAERRFAICHLAAALGRASGKLPTTIPASLEKAEYEMKTPMILPWLANRAGVSDHRAGVLWRAACRQAALLTGERDNSRYWGVAQQILLILLATERWKSHSFLAWPLLLVQDSLYQWSSLLRRWRVPQASTLPPLLRNGRPMQTCRA